MRRLLAVLMLGLMLFTIGCGGGADSYKNRDIDPNDPANAAPTPIPAPDSPSQ